jgi:hypothetical protein
MTRLTVEHYAGTSMWPRRLIRCRGAKAVTALSLAVITTALVAPAAPAVMLWDQRDYSDGYAGILSQNSEPAYDGDDTMAADDFRTPSCCEKWIVNTVSVAGTYSDTGPVDSVNVAFYTNKSSLPGTQVYSAPNVVPSKGLSSGSFVIPLPTRFKPKPDRHYWVSVQANMDFGTRGNWFWLNRSVVGLDKAAWMNPLDGFGTGCTTWSVRDTCVPSGDPDQIFSLAGKSKPVP